MNILRQFTRKSLLANRTRTLVTIIGIILSMALFTAVIEGAYSGQQFLIRAIEDMEGPWMAFESGLDAEQTVLLKSTDGVGESAAWQEVGWGYIDSENEYKPYLLVESADGNLEDLLAVKLLFGRMPEGPEEILLPAHLASNGGVQYHAGDTLTLSLGRRVDALGEPIPADCGLDETGGEALVDTVERRYTVVGVYERFSPDIESFNCPGYLALTRGGAAEGSYTLFYTLRHPEQTVRWVEEHPALGSRTVHSDLRRFYGSFGSDALNTLLYGFAGILVFLIAFGSISLIYNSFSISVSERTRQFGILKSVGATKRQIRASVFYEALLLSAVGIPVGLLVGCAGIGIVLYSLRDAFSSILSTSVQTRMTLVLNPTALLIAVLVCLVTTLISASVPAMRAIRVSPIDSIRQSSDVKLRGREVRTSRLTQKLFGFEGTLAVKNFKRNRRRYRSTVIGLFLSVVLFISASSFCTYLTDAVGGITGRDDGVDIGYYTVGENRADPEAVLAMLAEAGNVSEAAYLDTNERDITLRPEQLVPEARSILFAAWDDPTGKTSMVYSNLQFVQDEVFRSLCRLNGLDEAAFFDPAAPLAIVWNEDSAMVDRGSGSRIARYPVLDASKLPLTVESVEYAAPEGYVTEGGVSRAENGELELICYPIDAEGVPLWDEPESFPAEDYAKEQRYTVSAIARKLPFPLVTGRFTLFYPYSQEEAVLGERGYVTNFAFRAQDHGAAFNAMKTALVDAGMDVSRLSDGAADRESIRMIVMVVNVFAYGFIIMISLIAVANVFNTISTNVLLRRREFAMLRSIGLGRRGFRRMMNYECVIYGAKGLVWGLPAAVVVTWLIWRVAHSTFDQGFYLPWSSVAIAVGSVFAVVFATMLYASRKLRKDNLIDAMKNENL